MRGGSIRLALKGGADGALRGQVDARDFVLVNGQWLLSGVHSWGWQACSTFQLTNCDAGTRNSSSYGDLGGSTAVYSHLAWINQVTAVPEPASILMALAGLAVCGFFGRRR